MASWDLLLSDFLLMVDLTLVEGLSLADASELKEPWRLPKELLALLLLELMIESFSSKKISGLMSRFAFGDFLLEYAFSSPNTPAEAEALLLLPGEPLLADALLPAFFLGPIFTSYQCL